MSPGQNHLFLCPKKQTRLDVSIGYAGRLYNLSNKLWSNAEHQLLFRGHIVDFQSDDYQGRLAT